LLAQKLTYKLETKRKILIILPYWLIGLVLVIVLQTSGFLYSQSKPDLSQPVIPQVLGATTEAPPAIRGGDDTALKPISQTTEPDVSGITAQSFEVFDLASGQELLAKNTSQKFAIASLTKLMTALTAYNNSDLAGSLTITNKDVLNVKPNLDFVLGDQVKALDIFDSMLIGSCNDAALALADYVAKATGSNFVNLMNNQAASLGMANTSFANPMGFDSVNNYSTAQDLKLLIMATQKLSVFTDLGRRSGYSFASLSGQNYSTVATNTLIKNHPDIEAIKTGFTNEANGAMATKVDIAGHQIVILVLDSQNRELDTLRLKNILESNFDWN
jgi:serine-type D-Ala-D-Ala carboxypeptidase (penicillin-binding protein 5/6)